ncbi:YceI family protein [Gaetbulibacter aestuarii]|uniref:YceI family protein n=1 Tax=Gaetbulibacter aestuarii TaxID=1502358 RepID=A0ABW7N105_9FLAO
MKNFLVLIIFIFGSWANAQNRYITKTGLISFEASVPSFEEVAATNKSVTAIINTDNGDIAALALVTGFRFKNALMEEHFNENYAESNKFPKAVFKGTIEGFSLQKEAKNLILRGELTFHGVKRPLNSIPVILSFKKNEVYMKGKFKVLASDFEIEIPKIVRNKIAEDIVVTFEFELEKKDN